MGGSWGAYLKSAGYDGVVVSGKADKPVYLWVDGDKVEIRDAASLGQDRLSTRKDNKRRAGRFRSRGHHRPGGRQYGELCHLPGV